LHWPATSLAPLVPKSVSGMNSYEDSTPIPMAWSSTLKRGTVPGGGTRTRGMIKGDDCSVCLCSAFRAGAEMHATKALQGCPHLLPLLGMVDFSSEWHREDDSGVPHELQQHAMHAHKDMSSGRQPAVPHLQGYCTRRPHMSLFSYVHGGHAYGGAGGQSTQMYSSQQHSVMQLTGIAIQVLRCLVGVHQRGLVHTGM
jgi:hypothetical protein